MCSSDLPAPAPAPAGPSPGPGPGPCSSLGPKPGTAPTSTASALPWRAGGGRHVRPRECAAARDTVGRCRAERRIYRRQRSSVVVRERDSGRGAPSTCSDRRLARLLWRSGDGEGPRLRMRRGLRRGSKIARGGRCGARGSAQRCRRGRRTRRQRRGRRCRRERRRRHQSRTAGLTAGARCLRARNSLWVCMQVQIKRRDAARRRRVHRDGSHGPQADGRGPPLWGLQTCGGCRSRPRVEGRARG